MVTAERVFWSSKYISKVTFYILWSDHTWTEYTFKVSDEYTFKYKQTMNLRVLRQQKMDKVTAERYIHEQIKKIEA